MGVQQIHADQSMIFVLQASQAEELLRDLSAYDEEYPATDTSTDLIEMLHDFLQKRRREEAEKDKVLRMHERIKELETQLDNCEQEMIHGDNL